MHEAPSTGVSEATLETMAASNKLRPATYKEASIALDSKFLLF